MHRKGSCVLVPFWQTSPRSNYLQYDKETITAPQEAKGCNAMQHYSKVVRESYNNEDSQVLGFGQSG